MKLIVYNAGDIGLLNRPFCTAKRPVLEAETGHFADQNDRCC